MDIPDSVRSRMPWFLRRGGACPHTGQIRPVPERGSTCPQCVDMGDTWFHLRQCLTCGQMGCCDQSKNRHATAHFHSAGHPIIRSAQPGEDWAWCYVDERMVRGAG